MKIVVCFKNVYDEEDIRQKADRSLDFTSAHWKVGSYDLNAIEAASVLAEQSGGEVVALTAADAVIDSKQQTKQVLSRGPERMIAVRNAALETADACTTAKALCDAIKNEGDVDVVVFGEGSGDLYSRQVGALVGAYLGWPTVNAVCAMQLDGDALSVKRDSGSVIEGLRVSLPAAITVTSDINQPRVPKMKDILAAGKKPVDIIELSDADVVIAPVKTVSLLSVQEADRKQVVFEECSDEAVATLADQIKKLA